MSDTIQTQASESSEPIAFKAEIRQLLDILIHSLYTEREIFLREIISNASDALNQIRFEMLTNPDVHNPDAELTIRIEVDKKAKTTAITDTGIGMSAEELTTNLGTIAQSGARAFIDAAKENEKDLTDVIGQFGVGFYSAFMVAESVKVTSRSYHPDADAAVWYSTGDDTFTVSPAEKAERGTRIEIKFKDDAEEFAEEFRLREIIRKHSDYVDFPLYIGDEEEQVNRQTALWRQSPQSVKAEEYNEFHKHLTLDIEPSLSHIHIVADAPIQMYALLYLPGNAERGILSIRKDEGIKLYSRKVLIQEYSKDLLPEHYRFIQGVVDAEDLPLNVSRETVQSSPLMARLKKILTGRVTNKLQELAEDKDDTETYIKFWEKFGHFIKEGIATDFTDRESLYRLLRFHTTMRPDQWVSLNNYIGGMKPGQKKIYYLLGDDQRSIARSPHLDYFRRHRYEVMLLTDTIDSFMLLGIQKHEGFDLQNVAASDMELPAPEKDKAEETTGSMSDEVSAALVERFKEQLGERVSDVRTTDRLSDSMARLVDPEGALNQEMQRVYKLMERDFEIPKKVLELNPKHPTLDRLGDLSTEDNLSKAIMEQIYESALLIEGLHPDPASMLPRIEQLIAAALGGDED